VIPEIPTYENIVPVLNLLTVYTYYDSETGQDCGEAIIWEDWRYQPPYEDARY